MSKDDVIIHSFNPPVLKTQKNQDRVFVGKTASEAFDFHPVVKKTLGMDRDAAEKLELEISAKVDQQLNSIKAAATDAGFQQGKTDGLALAQNEFSQKAEPVFSRFQELLAQFESMQENLLKANQSVLVDLVFQIAKRVILDELKNDREYILRLISEVVSKMDIKDFVRIKIGPEDSQAIESIKAMLKKQMPDLKNIQIDVAHDFTQGGCKIETDLSRVDASVESQLRTIQGSLQK